MDFPDFQQTTRTTENNIDTCMNVSKLFNNDVLKLFIIDFINLKIQYVLLKILIKTCNGLQWLSIYDVTNFHLNFFLCYPLFLDVLYRDNDEVNHLASEKL